MNRGRSILATSGVVVLAVVAGCLTAPPTPAGDAGTTATPATTESPTPTAASTSAATAAPDSLDERLWRLYRAENRTEYADERGLRYADGRTEVVVELRAGAELPDGYDLRVTARHEELVQANASVDDLPALAREDGVRYVRPPHEPEADDPAEGGRQ